jgi:kynureninase
MARVSALLPGLKIVTPRQPSLRGSQVGIEFDGGYGVVQAMIERGVIGDFRAPDLMRFGFAPLYVRFGDVWDAAEILAECITRRSGAIRATTGSLKSPEAARTCASRTTAIPPHRHG